MVDRQRSVLSVPACVVACCGSPAPDRARSHTSVGDENAFDSREQRRPQKSAVGQRREVEAVVLIGQPKHGRDVQARRFSAAGDPPDVASSTSMLQETHHRSAGDHGRHDFLSTVPTFAVAEALGWRGREAGGGAAPVRRVALRPEAGARSRPPRHTRYPPTDRDTEKGTR